MSAENRKNKLVSDKNNTYFTENRIMKGSSIPTEGTYLTGDIIINDGSINTDEPMWICNEGGTPGKWGLVGSTNTLIVPSYNAMMKSKATVGSMIYVANDETDGDGPGFYIVLAVQEVNGVKIPATVEKINKKENNVPTLSYDPSMPEGTKMYLKDNEELILKFNFTANTYGDGKYRVYRDGVLLKSFSAAKGNVIVNLGKITMDGTFNITVTATDYLTIPAPETLSYTVIVGGLKLSSSFDEALATDIFEVGHIINFPYRATVADLNATMKLNIKLLYDNKEVIQDETITLSGAAVNGIWESKPAPKRGAYTLIAQAYTGTSLTDETEGTFISNQLMYEFRVLAENEIAITSTMQFDQIDNQTYLSIPFKVISKVANYFVVRGELFQEVGGTWKSIKVTAGNGISTAVNTINYWSVGKLQLGNYKFILRAYTVDGGIKSLEDEERLLTVVESSYERVQPITANLIAWFDANDKRNNDEEPNVWYNKSTLGDTYRILLHDLNYNSNGWKHVDPLLDDDEDGEMMLKFTGESYGELVKINNGQIEGRYKPFSIFENSGQPGITIETAFRTRCIGERNSRVITCMEKGKLDTPGVAISFEELLIGSDSQVNVAEFMEDEWVHVAFVIDNNIRKLDDIGQENIENLNQTKTIRIYINGVLCACNTYKNDKFLDASGNSFPLILNACLDNIDNPVNFGECEIKFLRIYNSYLTSSEVLTNYISHIYDQEEQLTMRDRNNVDIAVLPTITFRRNTTSNNTTNFGILNSITDKKTSKKTCVDCAMEFNDGEGNVYVYDNVDVYLQGTSSLQYPVKNYKIKCYNDAERKSKNKIVPPIKEGEWVPDYTYTFKCDYMEQSHMNNTPTAVFYDQVIEYLGGESPARKEDYRDSIDGFPCILYYDDGDGKNVLVGSFMFNIDKSGAELGFECDLYDEDGEVIGNGKNSCVSYEGTANASDTAGCFYKLEESIESVYRYYVEDEYKKYLEEKGLTEDKFTIDQFKKGIADGTIDCMNFVEFSASYDEIDYIMADFEARYSFNEDDDEATYKPMLDLVNWVSDSLKAGTFKKDFETHFDLKYMLAYFLQMQMFAQVDNCGKVYASV